MNLESLSGEVFANQVVVICNHKFDVKREFNVYIEHDLYVHALTDTQPTAKGFIEFIEKLGYVVEDPEANYVPMDEWFLCTMRRPRYKYVKQVIDALKMNGKTFLTRIQLERFICKLPEVASRLNMSMSDTIKYMVLDLAA